MSKQVSKPMIEQVSEQMIRPLFLESLLLATGNRGKYEEFLELLPRHRVKELLFAPDWTRGRSFTPPEVEETGTTYAANAFLKARTWACASGLPCLADDSGLEVEALSRGPGVRSARVVEGTDADRNRWLLSQLEQVERGKKQGKKQGDPNTQNNPNNRRARFVAAVALSVPFSPDRGEWTLVCEGVCNGRLGMLERGNGGFGYDPLFIPDGYDVSFGELPSAVKNKISHRAGALKNLLEIMNQAGGRRTPRDPLTWVPL
jgi:XTP/dITP diphosphohydrolase